MAHSEARQDRRASAISTAQPEDFFQLLKPRVMSLVVFTAATGLIVAQNRGGGTLHPLCLLYTSPSPRD